MTSRNAGRFTFESPQEGRARLIFEAPEPFLADSFLQSLCIGLGTAFELTRSKGTLTVSRLGPGRVSLDATWSPAL